MSVRAPHVVISPLNSFEYIKHNGKYVGLSYDDAQQLKNELTYPRDTVLFGDLTFCFITDKVMLMVDSAQPFNKQILEKYHITLATPPLLSFDFQLEFTPKTPESPPQAAIKLSEVLQILGRSGPRLTDVAEINMQFVSLYELDKKVWGVFSWNPTATDGTGNEQRFFAGTEHRINFNTKADASGNDLELFVYSGNSSLRVSAPGLYRVSGYYTLWGSGANREVITSIKLGGVVVTKTATYLPAQSTVDKASPIFFDCMLNITGERLENSPGKYVDMTIHAQPSVESLLFNDDAAYHRLHVRRV